MEGKLDWLAEGSINPIPPQYRDWEKNDERRQSTRPRQSGSASRRRRRSCLREGDTLPAGKTGDILLFRTQWRKRRMSLFFPAGKSPLTVALRSSQCSRPTGRSARRRRRCRSTAWISVVRDSNSSVWRSVGAMSSCAESEGVGTGRLCQPELAWRRPCYYGSASRPPQARSGLSPHRLRAGSRLPRSTRKTKKYRAGAFPAERSTSSGTSVM